MAGVWPGLERLAGDLGWSCPPAAGIIIHRVMASRNRGDCPVRLGVAGVSPGL